MKRILQALAAVCVFFATSVVTLPPMHGPNAHIRLVIEGLSAAVDLFALEAGRLPTDVEGLTALISKPQNISGSWNGPYLRNGKVPTDPWDTPFIYRLSDKSEPRYVIYSAGPNRIDDLGKGDDIFPSTSQEQCYPACRRLEFQRYASTTSLVLAVVAFIALLYFVGAFCVGKLSELKLARRFFRS